MLLFSSFAASTLAQTLAFAPMSEGDFLKQWSGTYGTPSMTDSCNRSEGPISAINCTMHCMQSLSITTSKEQGDKPFKLRAISSNYGKSLPNQQQCSCDSGNTIQENKNLTLGIENTTPFKEVIAGTAQTFRLNTDGSVFKIETKYSYDGSDCIVSANKVVSSAKSVMANTGFLVIAIALLV